MPTPTTKTELLKIYEAELIKQFTQYDGQNRPEFIFTARVDAPHGEACLRTQYSYINSTSTLVEKREDTYSTWDSTWDI